MKLVYGGMGHIIQFNGGYANELVIENKKMFFEMITALSLQADGSQGDFVLSIADKPVEFSKYVDLTLQFAPFPVNRKSLLTKLYSLLEQKAMLAENYMQTGELLGKLEKFVLQLAEDLPFEICCQRLAIGYVIRALAPELEDEGTSALEKIFAYMELVRELDHDRLFIMVNMRSYFADEDMERFLESVCLHDFKLLLVESTSQNKLNDTKRYTIDSDLCEF